LSTSLAVRQHCLRFVFAYSLDLKMESGGGKKRLRRAKDFSYDSNERMNQ
jgi:hypothetical protein